MEPEGSAEKFSIFCRVTFLQITQRRFGDELFYFVEVAALKCRTNGACADNFVAESLARNFAELNSITRQNIFHCLVVLARDVICRLLTRESNRDAQRRRNFGGKNFNVLARIDGYILKRRLVEVAGESLLRNDELAAGNNFDVRQIFHALFDKLESVGEGEFTSILFNDENIQLDDLRRRVFDKITMTEREGVAVHYKRTDWNFPRLKFLLVLFQIWIIETFYAARLELRRYTVSMITGGGMG